MFGQELQNKTSQYTNCEVIFMDLSNNNYGDNMKICKSNCIYQSDGICYKEKIAPIDNNSKCADFVEKLENNINSFPDIFNGDNFN